MTINIYWTDKQNSFFKEPTPVSNKLKDKRFTGSDIHLCPSSNMYWSNTFAIKSNIDYDIKWSDQGFESSMYDQNIFNDLIFIRDSTEGCFSFRHPNLLFIPDKSLEIEQLHPILSQSDITRKTALIQGRFNCYKHVRELDIAYHINIKNSFVNIKENDDLFYLRFLTDEKINFKRFNYDDIKSLYPSYNLNKNYTKKIKKLEYWYNLGLKNQTAKKMIKRIKTLS